MVDKVFVKHLIEFELRAVLPKIKTNTSASDADKLPHVSQHSKTHHKTFALNLLDFHVKTIVQYLTFFCKAYNLCRTHTVLQPILLLAVLCFYRPSCEGI